MKNECRFCNNEVIEGEVLGRNMNMRMMINNLQNMFGFEPDKQERCENGIQLQNGNMLCFDNSAREYALLNVEIRYCPFCGRELEYES